MHGWAELHLRSIWVDMSSPVSLRTPGTVLQELLEVTLSNDAYVATLRDCDPAKGEDLLDGAGRVSFQSGTVAYEPFAYTPLQVMRETVLTPPAGLDDAGRMLHALRAEVVPEMRVIVEANLSNGYGRWHLLYTHRGVLVAHYEDQ